MAAIPPGPEGRAPNPPSRSTLLLMTAGALVVGVLVVFGAVLPAEYHKDPLGLGKATGLSRLWAPAEVALTPTAGDQPLARDYPAPFRSDVVEITLASPDNYDATHLYELEYKVRMKKGGTYIYSWSVPGITDQMEFYSEFHGHTVVPANGSEKMVVSSYRKADGDHDNGSLVAPFDGIHGWYLLNGSAKPVTVTLRLSGFYELIAPGEEGNLTGIKPVSSTPAS